MLKHLKIIAEGTNKEAVLFFADFLSKKGIDVYVVSPNAKTCVVMIDKEGYDKVREHFKNFMESYRFN